MEGILLELHIAYVVDSFGIKLKDKQCFIFYYFVKNYNLGNHPLDCRNSS